MNHSERKFALSRSLEGIAVSTLVLSASSAFGIQYDLVNNNSQTVAGSSPAGAIFEKSTFQSTGTGVLDPFLRVQNQGNNTFEKGFNTSTSDNPPNWDAKNGSFTHNLLFNTLTTVNRGGNDYFQFIFDLGEPGNGNAQSQILLNTFDLYVSDTPSPTQSGISDDPSNLGDLKFSLGANSVMMIDESSGNGQSDVLISIPKFTSTKQYLYLFTNLGRQEGAGTADGSFEEIAALTGPGTTNVPDSGATFMLLGIGLVGIEGLRRRINI